MKNNKLIFAALISLILLPMLSFAALAMSVAPQSNPPAPFNNEYYFQAVKLSPKWWSFRAKTNIRSGSLTSEGLDVQGTAENWYVGGTGVYVGIDATKYTHFEMDVWGESQRPSSLKVELYDDDNGDNQIALDANGNPVNDDRFVYLQKVDWDGWKRVSIPVAAFKDDNPGIGDDVWNPSKVNGKGGLIQIQFILLASTITGEAHVKIKNIELIRYDDRAPFVTPK